MSRLRAVWLSGHQTEQRTQLITCQSERLEPRLVLSGVSYDPSEDPLPGTSEAHFDASGLWHSLDGTQTAALTDSSSGGSSYLTASSYESFSLDQNLLVERLAAAPMEFSGATGELITLPTPEGQFEQFAYWESPIMAPELAAKFPEIETFVGRGIDDPSASVRFDLTPQGFHAQILSASGSYYVDPFYHLEADGPYISYFKTDYLKDAEDGFSCLTQEVGCELDDGHTHADGEHAGGCCCPDCATIVSAHNESAETENILQTYGDSSLGDGTLTPLLAHGTELRTYELAVACTGEYTTYHGGTVQLAMAAIVTTMNRVGGIYEDDIAVRMELVANNDQLVYTNSSTDPYSNNNGFAMLSQNQSTIDSVIGSANYDIGHVFSTGGGGVAGLGVIGDSGSKAEGVTGQGSPIGDPFDVDYVAHEMGHQFGANHTFNGNNGNRNASTAMEPGSASTIMGYAGIMGSDDLQSNSDPYFHSISLDEMVAEITTGNANAAATITNTGNSLPTVDAGADYTIPAATPFVLTASGSDADSGDVLTYCWEQRDLGAQQGVNDGDNGQSPLFRSWTPTTSPERVFPRLSDVVDGSTVVGETLPTTDRDMNFRVTVRDSRSGGGGIDTDDMVVSVVDTGSAFAVTSPNTAVSWTGNATETVTWDVASTDSGAINTQLVDILVSTDGGTTFSAVATSVANDGSHDITVPNTATSQARLKVQAVGNIFFDVSDADFTILEGTPTLSVVIADASIGEGDGAAATTATATRSGATSGDLVVNLASNDTSEATVPSSVTILDGNSSVSFDIAAVDDSDVDGTQTVIVTASATGFTSGTDSVDVTDDETATVVIMDDGDAGFAETNFDYLANPGKPGYETDWHRKKIATGSGEASWTFTGLSSGDYLVSATWRQDGSLARASDAPYTFEDGGGTQLGTATGNQTLAPNDRTDSGANWEDLTTVTVTGGTLVVKLNESPGATGQVIADAVRIERTGDATSALSVVIADASIGEGDGAAATTATATRSGATSGDLVVNLASNDTSEATVPSSVTILDGNSSVSFDIAAVDDSDVDGTQTVIVTASATGFTSGTDSVDVTDDETATVVIMDDGDAGFAETNFDYLANPGKPGYETDWHRKKIATGSGEASWTFTGLSSGDYLVSATWRQDGSLARASDAPYTFEDGGGTQLGTATGNQTLAPNDRTDSGANWEDLTTVTVTGGTLVVKLNESPGATGQVIADAVRIERTGDATSALSVVIADASIGEGDGAAATTATATRSGATSGDLVVNLASNDTSEATVPSSVTILDGNSSVSFDIAAVDDSDVDGTQTVIVTASATGFTSGTDSVDVTDDETATVVIMDDGDAGFAETNFDYLANPGKPGYETDWHRKKIATGSGEASWTFTGLSSGDYLVSATWRQDGSLARASDAPYTFEDGGGTQLGTATGNQTLAPNDRTDSGANWEDLTTVTVTGGTLVVKLNESPGATGQVIADAVRIERTGDATSALSVVIADASIGEGDGAAATTATATRSGATSGDLVVNLASNDTSEATVPSSVTILDGNSSVSFDIAAVDDSDVDGTQTVIVTASATGFTSGTDSVDVTDDDTATVVIIDDGDAGFAETNFDYLSNPSLPGYDTDWHRKQAGTGSGEASWTFTGLSSGQYLVSATWREKSNRANDAPYTFEDGGGTQLDTATGNQQAAPNDRTDSGADWEDLTTVTVTGGTLVVKLNESPGATGQVIADAVRIERTGDAASGKIGGTIWDDADGDGTIDGSESLLEGWFVFLDQNQNGTLDATETALQTDSNGEYLFENLVDDTYYVTEILPDGWEQTSPSGSAKLTTVPLGPIQIVGGESSSSDIQLNWTENIDAGTVSIYPLGTGQQLGSDISTSSVQSAALMNADEFRTDPLFVGFDGTGFATVIIDSGADLDHPFFGADADSNGISDRIVYQYDFGNDDTNANDVDGHGTNVAGIAASSDSTYTGTASGADIIILKVFADSGSGSFFDVEDALQWVVTNATTYNIASINMSLGDGGTYDSPFSAEMLSDELASLVAMDVMVISAAGNEFTTAGTEGISYPAADVSSLAVSAVWDTDNGGPWNWSGGTTDNTTAADRVTSFSSRSSTWTDIFAPGAYITNAGLSGGVSSYSGTSQAAPQVAGIATVAQQLATATLGRRLTQAEFRSLMQSTGATINDGDDEDDNVTNTGADYSRVDMWALMRGILATAASGSGVHTTTIVSENTVSNINFGNRLSTGSRPPLIATEAAPGIPTSHVTASSAVLGSTATVSALSVHQSSGADARLVADSGVAAGEQASKPDHLGKERYSHRLTGLGATQPDRTAVPPVLDTETLSTWVDSMFAEQQPEQVASRFETEPVSAAASATGGEVVDQLLGKKDLFDVVDSWLASVDTSIGEQDAGESELSPLQEEALDIFRA